MNSSGGATRPTGIRREGDGLVIQWSDDQTGCVSWKSLRKNCPCATCRDEREKPADPFRILSPQDLIPKPPLAPVSMTPVGYYAYKIVWNDGHDTGIFTVENLRELCQPAAATSEHS